MNDDDDLPVLTQVLRTGDARDLHAVPIVAAYGPVSSIASKHEDVRLDQSLAADELVIGHEPHPLPPDDLAPPPDGDESHDPFRYAVTDDAGPADRADAFHGAQDTDHALATEAPDKPFDEPEIAVGEADLAPFRTSAALIVADGTSERRIHPFLAEQPRERRNLDSTGEPRDRRGGIDDLSLQRLASITSSVRESVLVALQSRIDTELDARIAQAMHVEVETAIARLQDKLRDRLTEALRDVVARAVDDEIGRFETASREAAARLDPRRPPIRSGN